MELPCPQCRTTLHLSQPHPYHAGFGDQGFLYCDTDSTIVTFSSYDRRYTALVGHVHPWMLDDEQRKAVEDQLVACPCGGRFLFAAEPRCPSCSASLSPALPGPGYYAILGRQLDGDRDSIWKAAPSVA